MLSKHDNELLCKVGPGTPMGTLMRHYWLPAFKSDELPAPDSPPMRIKLLGEELIAFRMTSGKIGLIQNACPHRGASLFFGRNEEEGLRCVYHGWKFDETGSCVDMPSEPAESNFRSKVHAKAYATQERGGVVWAYMGTREVPPPLPDIEPNMAAEGTMRVELTARDCNWMQALEGDIDTSHLGFLHIGALKLEDTQPGTMDHYLVKEKAPKYSVIDTEFGTSYGAYRPAEADTYYWRVAHFLFPCFTMIPSGQLGQQVLVRAWVPLDDDHTMYWGMMTTFRPDSAAVRGGALANKGMLPNTSDALGRFRLEANRENDYKIDREAQRNMVTYTGLSNVPLEDQAITESMGAIYTRDREHLGTSDAMIIRTRRRLIHAAKALMNDGTLPPGADDPSVYRTRSGGVILPRSADWVDATTELRKAFDEHPAPAPAAGS
ncbi:MAG TPA: Rieske 2Fe-2S domain-containing protein [Dehalococcoidia bacterium]|nr:Rieske 2Fe-2S domain-containing protein [Dehalococcoidia bacterium]